jgi:triosephosphate isomerase
LFSISLRAKLNSAINSSISVIFCIGEPSEVYSNGETKNFLSNQLAILNSEDLANITIAYEPIWAIGTGLSAKTSYVEDIHGFIKNHFKKILNNKKVSVVYGGSVKLDNAEEILSSDSVDGLLIGGASLDSETFSKIYNLS